MIIVDAHCDTITKIMELNSNLYKNECHVDIERMLKSGSFVQFFAAFVEPVYTQAYALKWAIKVIDKLYEQLEKYKDYIRLCRNYTEIESAIKEKKISALLSIEDGVALQGELSSLRILYKLGVRSICLTWNGRNEIADGVGSDVSGGGLTAFGREVVKEMNTLGMLVDVSHLSEKGFWDVMETTNSPITASHSNAKKICSHKRNLSDEQILSIKRNNGVIGINLYPVFLNNSGMASIVDVIKHIEHISSLAGFDHIGLGADFDGIESTPADIRGVQDMERIFNELLKLNYPEESVEKLAGQSFLRLFRDVMK